MVGSLSFAQQLVACHPGSPAIEQRRGRRPPPPLAAAPQWPASQRNNHKQRKLLLQAAASPVSLGAEGSNSSPQPGLLEAKQRLLNQVAGTERGGEAQTLQRGLVEEAQVAVEAFTGGAELDFGLLEGKWRLRYTTARDVLPLVSPQRLPAPLQVGRIYQQFSCLQEGRVQNIIEATLPPPPLPLLAGAELAVTLVVEAGYEARTARSIALSFREAGFRDVVPSPALQNLLASPLLPRGWWNQQLLLALTQLSGSVPLTTRPPGLTSDQRTPASGLNYMLTYLDEDMLIGRAQGNGGTFIFSREAKQGGEGEKAVAAQW